MHINQPINNTVKPLLRVHLWANPGGGLKHRTMC